MNSRSPTGDADARANDLICAAAASQLVVIDIQTKLGSVMPNKVLGRVVNNTKLLLQAAGLLGVPMLATEQYPQGLGPTSPALMESVPAAVQWFQKTCFSCTGADGFLAALEQPGRKQVVIAGMEAHVCVLQTAIELHTRGYRVFVVEDAICSRKLENYQNALVRLQQSGVIVVSAESIVFEWLRDAQHDHFKAISALVR